MNLEQEQIDRFYDTLENYNIETTTTTRRISRLLTTSRRNRGARGDRTLNEDELIDPESLVDNFSVDDPVRMYSRRSEKSTCLRPRKRRTGHADGRG
jgi:RNA polymerase primary sigma factor